jgi:hypothetical protein
MDNQTEEKKQAETPHASEHTNHHNNGITESNHSNLIPPTTETIIREEIGAKKCCSVSKDIYNVMYCCFKTWSFSLNVCEGGCMCLSKSCLLCSDLALGCNKCLEQMDCDGH